MLLDPNFFREREAFKPLKVGRGKRNISLNSPIARRASVLRGEPGSRAPFWSRFARRRSPFALKKIRRFGNLGWSDVKIRGERISNPELPSPETFCAATHVVCDDARDGQKLAVLIGCGWKVHEKGEIPYCVAGKVLNL